MTLRNIYHVEKFEYVHNELHFSLYENEFEIQFKPARQVIADSDHMAFVYLIEEGDNYSYIRFTQEFWPQLVESVLGEYNPFLKIGNESRELEGFRDELLTLVYNIEGNDNYGEEFVKAVEESFEQILQGNGK
nr:hypothetical protein [Lysinibacillus timonensis]